VGIGVGTGVGVSVGRGVGVAVGFGNAVGVTVGRGVGVGVDVTVTVGTGVDVGVDPSVTWFRTFSGLVSPGADEQAEIASRAITTIKQSKCIIGFMWGILSGINQNAYQRLINIAS
jgi:hypothetical protein